MLNGEKCVHLKAKMWNGGEEENIYFNQPGHSVFLLTKAYEQLKFCEHYSLQKKITPKPKNNPIYNLKETTKREKSPKTLKTKWILSWAISKLKLFSLLLKKCSQ